MIIVEKDGRREASSLRRRLVAVEPLAHLLAGLEERHALLVDRDMRAGARVAAGACRSALYRKGAKAAQLHPIALRQRADDFVEDRVDDVLDVALVEVRVLRRDALYQFGLDHRSAAPLGAGDRCCSGPQTSRSDERPTGKRATAQLLIGGCQSANRPSRLSRSSA